MVFVIWYCASLRKRSCNQLFCTENQQTSYCAPPACWGYPLPCLFSPSKRIFHSAVLLKWSEPFWFLLRSHLLTFCSLWGRKLWCSPMGVTFVSSDTFFFSSWLSLIYYLVWYMKVIWNSELSGWRMDALHRFIPVSLLYVLLEGAEGFTCPSLSLCKLDILIWVCHCFCGHWGEGGWGDSSSGNASTIWL